MITARQLITYMVDGAIADSGEIAAEFGLTETEADPYIDALVALHNLAVVADRSRELGARAPGVPVGEDPHDYVCRRIQALADELCPIVREVSVASRPEEPQP